MKDPHVESLIYRVETEGTLHFQDPPPLDHQTHAFDLRVDDGRLTMTMKDHYASRDEAREAVKSFLEGWEIDWALRNGGRREIKFVYEKANVVDREPRPPGATVINAETWDMPWVGGEAHVVVNVSAYPVPPSAFRIPPDVETLWNRYEGFMKGKEPLLSMAYFCLTVVETMYGGGSRSRAGTVLQIDPKVLNKLGELTSERGDAATARKVKPGPARPLSGAESAWVDETIRAIIRRAGNLVAGGTPEPVLLMLTDLPTLQ
ncbi:MAG TPA: hypothetical protein VK548_01400 [Candidatus Acidoferrum sp.]|nr:hypothetical protein [Candidatus Acidoferrum sp.]